MGPSTGVTDIDDNGVIVGYSYSPGSQLHGVEWSTPTSAPRIIFNDGPALALNNTGTIVGIESHNFAASWINGTVEHLDARNSSATAVNESGVAVGSLEGPSRAVMWKEGKAYDLGWGANSGAVDINDQGLIVGHRGNEAVLWSNGETLVLPGFGLGYVGVSAINNVGVAVGTGLAAHGRHQNAVAWIGNTATVLPSLSPDWVGGVAGDINDAGLIVGYSYRLEDHRMRATIWSDGIAIDLNDSLSSPLSYGWELSFAQKTNASGWIVGSAFNPQTNEQAAFFALPRFSVAEPSQLALTGIAMAALLLPAGARSCSRRRMPLVIGDRAMLLQRAE
jgi:hypothetical protein